LTAHEAIKSVTKEEHQNEKKVRDAINIIKSFLDLIDFELIERIKIKDKKTGKQYK
jgi:hypothetical protein